MAMNCIKLETLIEMWAADSVIDKTEPGEALLNIPVLHSKYITQISAHSVALKFKMFEYTQLKRKKTDYYLGRMDQAALDKEGWTPFKFILKGDVAQYLESDNDLLEQKKKMINNEESIAFCERVVKELNNRTWSIKEFCGWEKFIRGQF